MQECFEGAYRQTEENEHRLHIELIRDGRQMCDFENVD